MRYHTNIPAPLHHGHAKLDVELRFNSNDYHEFIVEPLIGVN